MRHRTSSRTRLAGAAVRCSAQLRQPPLPYVAGPVPLAGCDAPHPQGARDDRPAFEEPHPKSLCNWRRAPQGGPGLCSHIYMDYLV